MPNRGQHQHRCERHSGPMPHDAPSTYAEASAAPTAVGHLKLMGNENLQLSQIAAELYARENVIPNNAQNPSYLPTENQRRFIARISVAFASGAAWARRPGW